MPRSKKKSKETIIEATTKNTIKLTKELTEKFPDIPGMTLMHLAVAINLKYTVYITDNVNLLDKKDYFLSTYNIQIMQPYEMSEVNTGMLI